MGFTNEQLERYSRHIILKEICILPLPAWERSELWMRMWWIYPICSGR